MLILFCNSPLSPSEVDIDYQDEYTAATSCGLVWGFGFCQWAFAAYAPFRPLFHVPLTTPLALRRCLRTFCPEVPSRPNFPSCFLGEAGDAGAELPQKLTITTNAAESVLP